MNHEHEHEHEHGHAPSKGVEVTSLPHAIQPGRLSRSALLRKPDHAIHSGLLQRKPRDSNGVVDGAEHAVATAASSSSSPLPHLLQRKFESSLGVDLSGVRVHTGTASEYAADAVGAKAYTMGQDIHFGAGNYDPASASGQHLLAHEVAHTVQQSGGSGHMQCKLEVSSPGGYLEQEADRAAEAMAAGRGATVLGSSGLSRFALQRQDHNSTPASAQPPDAPVCSADDPQQQYQTALSTLTSQACFDPSSDVFAQYCSAQDALSSQGNCPAEPQGFANPPNQIVTSDENGTVQLMDGSALVEVDDALLPRLDQIADAADGGGDPGGGTLGQVLVYDDGRVVSTPPATADLATLLNQGQPLSYGSGLSVSSPERPWRRVAQAGAHGVFGSGVYQLGTFPISRFMGVNLPAGSRIRFADPSFAGDSRLFTIFETGSKRFFAWDGHAPVGGTPHNFYHVNQKGMFGLFGRSNHANLAPAEIGAARGLRVLRLGGRAFLLIGIAVDAAYLTQSVAQSLEQGTPRPAIAQAIRTVGSWGGAWAGAKLGCAAGGLAGVETGPGMALTCLAGGIVGGFAGYFGADWIADMISED